MKKIVLATRNKGKIAELAKMLAGHAIEVVGLDEFPQIGEIAETGATFAENALLKARAVAQATGLTAIADDSGLVVDALGGAPGVYSARYSDNWGELPNESRDSRNIRKLLHALRHIPASSRKAHFASAIAVVEPEGKETVATGQWHGHILARPLGSNGFGYDPVFFDEKLGKTAAQLSQEEKNAVSHRHRALEALLAVWPG